jgi:hypothetical protein
MSNQPASRNEAPEELARLREDLIAFYRPINSQERFAVERIALAQQSLRRVARLEATLFAAPDGELLETVSADGFKFFLRYQAQAERAYKNALDELALLQAGRPLALASPKPAAHALKPPALDPLTSVAPSSPSRAPAAAPIPAPAAAAASKGAAANLALRL